MFQIFERSTLFYLDTEEQNLYQLIKIVLHCNLSI
jgi:hypothetical protein